MTEPRFQVRIATRPCVGYGGDEHAASRLDAAFAAHLPSERTIALKIPFDHDQGPPGIDATMAVKALPDGALKAHALAGLPSEERERLGGLFFLYASGRGMRVGPRRVPTPDPVYFLMSHGLVVLNKGLLQTGIEPDFVAEHLTKTSLALLGRSGSNHDKVIFTAQAARLVGAITAASGYRGFDIRLVDAPAAS